MSFIKIKDTEFFYEVTGSGAPLVLISGFTVDHTIWGSVVEQLSKNFSVLTFDNRGAGQSSTPDYEYSIEMMADDAIAIAQQVFGGKKVNVVGQSMGGAIAQTIAHK